QATLTFSPGLNLIVGPNASGKTSLLEAISLICQGRSFRTPRIDQLIKHHEQALIVFGQLRVAAEQYKIGLSREQKKTQVKINGERIKGATELVGKIALFVLTPESHELLDSGPKMRRQYLDWGVFHVEHQYLSAWQAYHRILRQRNTSLRHHRAKQEIQAWDKPLLEQAEKLHHYRGQYIAELTPLLSKYGEQLIGEVPRFDYYPGWKTGEMSLAEQLQSNLDTDMERGFTRLGPHRADIKIKVEGKTVQSVFSRGQQKLLICAMTLAQLMRLASDAILLVDDLPAELDPGKRAILLEALKETGAQVMVTATEPNLIDISSWEGNKMFHVERGSFQEVV
ncbi:MAG: DNA replication/repair protein RecF, partial [Thioalkalispiraceae bacterium]